MRKTCLASVLLLSGCGPLAIDATIGWGANQSIKKTLEMDQKQTKAQTEAGTEFWEGLFDVLPAVVTAPPPPPPEKRKIQSITIQLEPTPQPTPERVTIEDRYERIYPKRSTKRKSLPPSKPADVCRCEVGSGNLCTYHNDNVTCEPMK